GAFRLGTAVAHPFSRPGDDCLSGAHVERAALVFDAEHAAQDDGDFLEGGSLTGLDPAAGRHHARDADTLVAGVDAAGIFLDALGLVAGSRDDGGSGDEKGHEEGYKTTRLQGYEGLRGYEATRRQGYEAASAARSWRLTIVSSTRHTAA